MVDMFSVQKSLRVLENFSWNGAGMPILLEEDGSRASAPSHRRMSFTNTTSYDKQDTSSLTHSLIICNLPLRSHSIIISKSYGLAKSTTNKGAIKKLNGTYKPII